MTTYESFTDLQIGILGVGHGADHGDSAGEGGGGAAGEVLLVDGARVAEVDVHVDEAGQPHDPARGDAVHVRLQLRRLLPQNVHRFWKTSHSIAVAPLAS